MIVYIKCQAKVTSSTFTCGTSTKATCCNFSVSVRSTLERQSEDVIERNLKEDIDVLIFTSN